MTWSIEPEVITFYSCNIAISEKSIEMAMSCTAYSILIDCEQDGQYPEKLKSLSN